MSELSLAGPHITLTPRSTPPVRTRREDCSWSPKGGWALCGPGGLPGSILPTPQLLSTPGPRHSHLALALSLPPSRPAGGPIRSASVTLWGRLLPAWYRQQSGARTSQRDIQAPVQLAATSPLTHSPQHTLCSGHSRFPNRICFCIPQCLCIGCSLGLECPSQHLHSVDCYSCLKTQLECSRSQTASSTHPPPIRPTFRRPSAPEGV